MSNIRIDVTANVQGAVTGLNQVRKATQTTSAAINSATTNMRKINGQVTTSQKNFRKFAMGGMQQAGYQIGDYAVQVANGTSKMQAFGQQAPQLLQIFGPVGAVVGAAVAIFAAFGVAVERSGKQVENASVVFGVLAEPLVAVKDAVIALKASFAAALPAISSNLDTAIIAVGLLAAVTGVKMVASMLAASASSGIFAAVMVSVRAAVLAAALGAGTFNVVMVGLRSAVLLTGAAVKAVGALMMRFLPIAILLSVAKLIEMFLQLRRGAGGVGLAFGLLRDVAEEVFDRMMMRAAKMWTKFRLGVNNFKLNFINALIPIAEKFDVFAEQLTRRWNEMFPTDGLLAPLRMKISGGVASELEGVGRDLEDQNTELENTLSTLNTILSKPNASLEALRAAFAKGADGALVFGDAVDDASDKSSKLSDPLADLIAKTKIQQELLRVSEAEKTVRMAIYDADRKYTPEQIANGIKIVAAYNKQAEAMDAIKDRAKDVASAMSSSMESAMMSMVDGTKSVKEAFKSMAAEIIKDLYRIFVVKKITGLISGKIESYMNPAMPAIAGARAMGGQVTGGKAYMVGERGPEMVVPSRNGHVVPNNQVGGGSGVTIIQNNTFGNGVNRAEINAMLPKIVEASKAAVLDARRRGGSYAGAF